MKKTVKILTISVLVATSLSSCIKETFPQGQTVTNDQAEKVPGATSSFVAAMPTYMKRFDVSVSGNTPSVHYEFGMPAMMLRREAMGQDLIYTSDNYNHWWRWYAAGSRIMGPEGTVCYGTWTFYYKEVYLANTILNLVPDPLAAEDVDRWNSGIAAFYKAFSYFDLVRMHTTKTYLQDPTAPGIPLVSKGTNVANNPRVSIGEVYEEIERLLLLAKDCLIDYTPADYTDVSVEAVYGELARFYLEKGEWANAENYAHLAQAGHSVTTDAQWNNLTTGLSVPTDAWLWGCKYVDTERAITSGIINWASWACFEQSWGYGGSGTGGFLVVDAYLYSKIPSTDFRQKNIVNTSRSNINTVSQWYSRSGLPQLAWLKFRPAGGASTTSANPGYLIQACVSVPFMRVEEMFLIEAEAAGRQNLANGKAKLENFVKTRDAAYTCTAADLEAFINDVFLQRRIEFWGEGITYFDYKRLDRSMFRWYTVNGGTLTSNHRDGARFNITGQPTWMNLVIPLGEVSTNHGLGPNNPTPENPVQATTPIAL